MQTMTLGRKIGLGFGGLILITALLGGMALNHMRTVRSDAHKLATEYVAEAQVAAEFNNALGRAQLDIRSYGFTTEASYLASGRTNLVEVHTWLESAQKLADAHPDLVKLREELKEITPLLASYEQAVAETETKNKEILANRQRLNMAAAGFTTNIEKLIQAQEERLGKEIKSFTEVGKLEERVKKLVLATEIRDLGNAARIAVFKAEALRDLKIIEEGLKNFESMEEKFTVLAALLHVQADGAGGRRQVHLRVVGDAVPLEAGGHPERDVGGAGQADRRAHVGHAVFGGRHAGHERGRQLRRVAAAGHAQWSGDAAGTAATGAARRAECQRGSRSAGAGRTRCLEILVADPDDPEDRAASIGLDDRSDAGVEPRADERLHARDGQFLILRVGQIHDLGDEVAGRHLVEVLVGELEWHGVVGQIGRRPRRHRRDFEGGIQLDALAARDVGELEPVDRPLREVVAARGYERFRVEASGQRDIPANLHPVRAHEPDLRGGRQGTGHSTAGHGRAGRGQ